MVLVAFVPDGALSENGRGSSAAALEGERSKRLLVDSSDRFVVHGAWVIKRFDHNEDAADGYLRNSMSLESRY